MIKLSRLKWRNRKKIGVEQLNSIFVKKIFALIEEARFDFRKKKWVEMLGGVCQRL